MCLRPGLRIDLVYGFGSLVSLIIKNHDTLCQAFQYLHTENHEIPMMLGDFKLFDCLVYFVLQ